MYLPNPNGLTLDKAERKILEFLASVQAVLSFDNRSMGRLLASSESEYIRIIRGASQISAVRFQNLLNTLNLDYDHIFNETVDYSLLSGKLDSSKVNVPLLPERYAKGAFGKRRTIINLLDYIEKKKGPLMKALILRDFQLSSEHFQDPDTNINNNFIVDFLNRSKLYGFTDADIVAMGEHSYDCNLESELGKKLNKLNSPKEVFECIFGDYIEYFDRNFNYQFLRLNSQWRGLGCSAKSWGG